jgi:DNA-binding transcriptional LysR family regulator
LIDGINDNDDGVGMTGMTLSGVDLNLLVALDALLTERNVTRAAERVSVGQPAMSASLARLRKHFGDPLLVRQGRGLEPTPLAESLARSVQEAIATVEAVLGSRAAFDPGVQRTFTIVASDYITLVLLRPMFSLLAAEAPGIRINVIPVVPDYARQLRCGQVDMLIVPTALSGRLPFPHVRLFTERFLLACDRDNTAVTDFVEPEQFSRMPYLSYGLGTLQGLAELELAEAGIERRVEVSTQSLVSAPFLLTGTDLVSLIQERLGQRFGEYAHLRLLEPPIPLRPVVEALYWNPRHNDDPAHRWLRARLAEQAQTL